MANSAIENVYFSFTKRSIRSRGPLPSSTFNDMNEELSVDFASIYDQWNNRLTPLVSLLPNAVGNDNIDAYTNGLDGRTMYVHSSANSSSNSTYYNSTQARPNSIYDQFINVYSQISTLTETLQNSINTLIGTASQVSINDSSNLFVATNVENALSELSNRITAITTSTLDLSTVAQNYVPASNNIYDIGSTTKKIQRLYATQVNTTTKTPTGTADTSGSQGDITWDDSYIYVKTSAGWKRAGLSTW